MLSESYKSSLGLSEITTKCKRLHLNLQMWALLHLFGLFSVVCIPFIRILLIRFKSNKIYSGSTLICSLFRLSFCAGAGFGRGAAPPATGNELLFHCYLFPVPPAGPSFVPQSICRGNSRKGRHGYPGGSRSSLCLDINQKKFLVVSSIILDIHY